MGAWVSVLLGMDGAAAAGPAAVGLGDLPELCAAQVLLRLDPPEICRLAQVNHAFRGAAGADFVWEAKLPENYNYLMEFVGSGDEGKRRRRRAGKKEIYARLARPVPFGDGKKVRYFASSFFAWLSVIFITGKLYERFSSLLEEDSKPPSLNSSYSVCP
jgi:hypothetical protein